MQCEARFIEERAGVTCGVLGAAAELACTSASERQCVYSTASASTPVPAGA